MADKGKERVRNTKCEKRGEKNVPKQTGSGKKKVSSRLVLLQGIRKLAMPSRSFSEGTQNVSSMG